MDTIRPLIQRQSHDGSTTIVRLELVQFFRGLQPRTSTRKPMKPDQQSRSAHLDSATPEKGDIKELGRYRNFLRLQAMGIPARYRPRLESSDIVQQTLLDAHENIHQFRGKSEPEMAKWLSQMLANNISDAMRALGRQKRDISRERPLDQGGRSSMRCAADWIASEQTSPSLVAYKAEQVVQLSEAISQLPEAQQEVIVLHHLHGRSLADVAAHIERSPSAVAGLLYRGLKALRNQLN